MTCWLFDLRSIRDLWVVRGGLEPNVSVVLLVYESMLGVRLVVYHPSDTERIYVPEGTDLLVLVRLLFLLVVMRLQVILEAIFDRMRSIILGKLSHPLFPWSGSLPGSVARVIVLTVRLVSLRHRWRRGRLVEALRMRLRWRMRFVILLLIRRLEDQRRFRRRQVRIWTLVGTVRVLDLVGWQVVRVRLWVAVLQPLHRLPCSEW